MKKLKGYKGDRGCKGIKGIPIIKIKSKIYCHRYIKIGWFRFAYYRLGKKFTIRIELSKGWDN